MSDKKPLGSMLKDQMDEEFSLGMATLRDPTKVISMYSSLDRIDRMFFAKLAAKSLVIPTFNKSFYNEYLLLGRSVGFKGSEQVAGVLESYASGGQLNMTLKDKIMASINLGDR